MSRFRSNYGVIGPRSTQYLYQTPQGLVDTTTLSLFNTRFFFEIYCWGAGGGGGQAGGWTFGAPGGAGGAAFGILPLRSSTSFTVMVGGPGVTNGTASPAGGGGPVIGGADNRYGASGGGLSGIFFQSIGYTQGGAILIAGGGGGGGSSRAGTGNQGGAGGGTNGENGYSPYDGKTNFQGQGGTQTAAGGVINNSSSGQGALQGGTCTAGSGYGGGGGGGYWGGSGGGYSESNTMSGGGGGSGFANASVLTTSLLTAGVATTPGDSANSLRGSYGNAGAVASTGTQGVVIIRYSGLPKGSGGTITTASGITTHTFTTTGTNTFNIFL